MQPDAERDATERANTKQGLKLIVLGATGGTGLELVRQAIERGHFVTALVRSPERLKEFQDRMKVRQGDLLNTIELAQAIQGHDAVLSGFGPRVPISKADANLLERFALALTTAMPHAGVRRVIVESVAFLFKNSIFPPAYLLGRLFFSRTVVDASAMEYLVAHTDLDLTMVRPPVREDHLPHFGLKVSRADVADLMINLAETGRSIRKVVGISN